MFESKYKVGDIVMIMSGPNIDSGLCEKGTVITIENKNWIDAMDLFLYSSGIRYSVEESELERPPIDNPINRKLYPNYVEHKGYLVPKKILDY